MKKTKILVILTLMLTFCLSLSLLTACDLESIFSGPDEEKHDHSFTDWYTVIEPTEEETGYQQRDCTKCDFFETKTIPTLVSKSYNGVYTVEFEDERQMLILLDGMVFGAGDVGTYQVTGNEISLVVNEIKFFGSITDTQVTLSSSEDEEELMLTKNGEYALLNMDDNGFVTYKYCDDIYLCGYVGKNRNVQIPENVTVINDYVFADHGELRSVNIPDGVISIGERGFYGCGLSSVTIPDSVTSIGYRAFACCYALTSITIGERVTDIENFAFEGCNKLIEVHNKSSLNIVAGNSSNGEVAYYAKNVYTPTSGSSKLSTDNDGYVTYTDGDEVLLVGYVGEETELVLPNNITGIYELAFCESCISVVKVPYLSVSIDAYSRITSIVIPDSVRTIDSYSFLGCFNLVRLTLGANVQINDDSSNNGQNVPINVLLSHCVRLKELINRTNYVLDFGSKAIDIYNKTDIFTQSKISNENGFIVYTNGVEKILVNYLGAETELIIPEGISDLDRHAFYYKTDLTSVTIPDSVKSIGNGAFNFCNSLKRINIGKGVNDIGSDDYGHAFDGCIELENITVDDSNEVYRSESNCIIEKETNTLVFGCKTSVIPDSITAIGASAFSWRQDLTSIEIPDSVETIGFQAFYNCWNLEYVSIGDGVTSIGELAFYYCNSLTSVTIGDSVTSIGDYAFSNCNSLTSVTIGDSVTSIGDYAFSNCNSLTSVTIGDSVTTIGDYAFSDCNSLTSVVIPDSVTTIGDSAFSDCNSLTSVVIPDSVTTIGERAFNNCDSLTSVVIPDSVTTIGDSAFYYCDRLTSVFYVGTEEEWNAISIESGNSELTFATIYYYSESQPTDEGNYWHYDADGVTPVIWTELQQDSCEGVYVNEDGIIALILADEIAILQGLVGKYEIMYDTAIYLYFTYLSIGLDNSVTEENLTFLCIIENDQMLMRTGPDFREGVGTLYKNIDIVNVYVSENGNVFGIKNEENILLAYLDTESDAMLFSNITEICDYAVYFCDWVTRAIIPSDVKKIGYNAFYGCSSLTTIYYTGTAEDWDKIYIGNGNEDLTAATIYYYSDSQPTDGGNYWHYDADGVTPVIWD